jgi:SAM-dependent methyltransferase
MTKKIEWFKEWFDTKYYHILYNDRNDEEAHYFIRNLLAFLQLDKKNKILDLPCGKGRHSIFLNSLGYDVMGADLSQNSIIHAKQFENESLQFMVHDIRDPLNSKFDAIFNLFTSFGYFEDIDTNINVLKNLKNGLAKNGILVIDFMNVNYVKNHLVKKETIIKKNIEFKITRSIKNNFIIKDIHFLADGQEHHFTEKVNYLTLDTMTHMVKMANLKLKNIFGDYSFSTFDINNSNRLILILE